MVATHKKKPLPDRSALESCSHNSTMIGNAWLISRVVVSWFLSGHGAGSSDITDNSDFGPCRISQISPAT